MTLTIPRAAAHVAGRRPVRGNLLVRDGVIGVGTLKPRHGKVAIEAGANIRVTGGIVPNSGKGQFGAFRGLLLGARNMPNPAYVSVQLSNGSAALYEVDGVAAPVLAAKLRTELAPLGATVTVG
jgi:hypothetical protein